MRTLFIDLASHEGSIACVGEDGILAMQIADHKISDAELIPAVEDLLKQATWTYQDLTQVACVTGPGGFTSLRIAAAYANVLADQLGVPSTGIHLSDLYRARAHASVYWLHSTKKHELFIRGGQWEQPTLILLTEAQANIPEGSEWMGELLPEHEKHLSSLCGLRRANIADLPSILPAFLENCTYTKELIEPWYGRSW